jgi:formylmethanofuran dehydrogenase subunit B
MLVRAATCPFCGLLCDDLTVDCDGAVLRPVQGACARSRAEFAKIGTPEAANASARIAGAQASNEAALDAAATFLRQTRRPLIGGLSTDVAGMRATLELARRIGAVVDHMASQTKYRNLHVLQEFGWTTTTLAEVKNRADLVLLIGDGWHTRFPRFVERVLAPKSDLSGHALTRRIVLVDEAATSAQEALPADCERLLLNAPSALLPALFSLLSAQAAKQPVGLDRIQGIDAIALARCVEWMLTARYGVFVWAAADLDFAHA